MGDIVATVASPVMILNCYFDGELVKIQMKKKVNPDSKEVPKSIENQKTLIFGLPHGRKKNQ
jgi:hypothetical protein